MFNFTPASPGDLTYLCSLIVLEVFETHFNFHLYSERKKDWKTQPKLMEYSQSPSECHSFNHTNSRKKKQNTDSP